MKDRLSDCIDCGTENCPCCLAKTRDCLTCSRLQGKDYCDCNWRGVCVYNEFIQSGSRIGNTREEFIAPIIKRTKYLEDFTVFEVGVDKGFALKCEVPGTYVFLRGEGKTSRYDMPISLLKSDTRQGRIWLAVKETSAKSKAVAAADKQIYIRGIYRNGIIGNKQLMKLCKMPVSGEKKRRLMLITKGVGFAPAAIFLKWAGEKAEIDILADTDKVNEDFIRDFLPEEFCGSLRFVKLQEITEQDGEALKQEYKRHNYDGLGVFASNYYIDEIKKTLPVMACSNNFTMCCGEGVCGACIYTDDKGRIFKMCKCMDY